MALNQHKGLISGIALIVLTVGVFARIYPAYYVTSYTPTLVLKESFGLSPNGHQ